MGLQILNTCKEVMSQSKDVKIISSNVPKLAEKVFYSVCCGQFLILPTTVVVVVSTIYLYVY